MTNMCQQQLAQSETSGAENNTTSAIISDRQRCFEKKKLKGSGDFTPETLLLSFIKKMLSLIPLHAVVHWLVVFLPLLTIFAMITALGNTVFVVKLVFAHITGAALYFYSVCLYPGMKSVLPFQRLTIIPETPAKGFNKRVAVIGAGPMGLATAKELLEQGHEVTCYDASPMLGGEFANRFWTGGHLTSSPYITAFSDFEPLKCEATGRDNFHHLSKEDYVTYLEKYSAAHGVTATLCLNEKVVRVLTKEGRHSLVLQNAINGTERTDEDFDHVAVCTGVNSTPSMYKVDGMGTFPGQILHSSDFARKDSFEETFGMLAGKRVLTLGIGESMADLIYLMNTSTSTPPSSCTASIARKGTFVIPRVNPLNNEINDFDTTRLRYSMPRHLLNLTIVVCMYLRNVFSCKRCKEGKIRFDLFRGMKWPAYSKATKSDNFVKSIAAGMCDVKVGVSKINNRSVHFVDGSVLEDVDVIIFGTGFTTDYPFVKETRSLHGSNKFTCFCPTKRFLRMFDPSFGDSIAFIGPGTRPIFGSNPTVGEAQARLFALIVSGKRLLPSVRTMNTRIEQDEVESRKQFSETNTNWKGLVHWIPFMDTLATEIGCLPCRSLLFTNPKLWMKLLIGPMTAFHYRLHGPGSKPEIAEAILMKLPIGTRFKDLLFYLGIHLTVALLCWPIFAAVGIYNFTRRALQAFLGWDLLF